MAEVSSPSAASVSPEEREVLVPGVGTGDTQGGLLLVMKPNSTTCRAADGFGKMHRHLWPSAPSLPPAAALH